MKTEHFDFLYDLEESYWWFVAMRRISDTIAAPALAAGSLKILDAGCGAGYNLLHYEQAGHEVFGFDLASDAVARTRARVPNVAQASVTAIPFKSESFDLVFSFDVLEQVSVETAREGIHEMHRVLKPGGHLFVRAPAYEWLRSSHDESIQTVHRYTLGELERLVRSAGFQVSYTTYANTFLFPVVLMTRVLKRFGIGGGCDVRPLPAGLRWLDQIFRRILSSEAVLARMRRPLPFGLSAICYSRKPS